MSLLTARHQARQAERERLRLATRDRLRSVLARVLPGETVHVFGSITKPGRFFEGSDIDIALEHEPSTIGLYELIGLLHEELGSPVDVLLLTETRFREKILLEGELWMN
jgi:predicted nucleotidyltransferase